MNQLTLIQALIILFHYKVSLASTLADPTNLRGSVSSDTDEANLRVLGSSKSEITRFDEFKLTPNNEKSPFKGVDRAAGSAIVTLDFNPSRSKKYKVCIRTKVFGFIPGLLHVHKGKLSENGAAVIDYSDMLSTDDSEFYGCASVAESLFKDIRVNPHLYYVNAHVAGSPTALFNLAIRGQLIQKYSTSVVPSEEVSPFKGKSGASGFATVSFESGGSEACIDATIKGFDPVLAHLHNAKKGSNGGVVIDFSGEKVAPGRFLGCGKVKDIGTGGISTVLDILKDPTDYYFNFHLGASGSDFNTAIRGQLDRGLQ